ncbi:sigma-70 family RNA polymerase sigma factor [Sporosarcina gallistercoris]|uniref:Sigma-70 family RNA polymerase sigma factor n=1 Tax=Sporosarcina gallistercoris TaxID=2762245 RepID=A0ABR8PFN5_9BACL|nr:sigma-70 family RNA polymerase sigma factor [Sporosarcina gallistercoris]MBD7906983.1 sigma-70 family RNA polymerase sigma factor [Sporosarcina gallistercoris]
MDDSVFHHLYDTYHHDVFNFLTYLTKDRQLAEDLSHEVYVKAIRAYSSFEGRSSEKTWLFAIAKNVSIDYFRKMKVRSKHDATFFDWDTDDLKSSDKTPEQQSLENEDMRSVLKKLDACTLDQRLVIIMRYFNDLSIADTAEVLGWSHGKVKTTQHRALKSLRAKLTLAELERGEPRGSETKR